MAFMTIQKAASSSCTTTSCNSLECDVFLSFRGEDTRNNFTNHLYTALNRVGIKVFKDDKELEREKMISPELIKAIEKLRFSLIVLSRNYASSTWCLEELVKIIECKNIRGQIVFPIFYDMDPSIVRNQRGSFEEAFINYKVTENIGKVQKWKSALKEVADLSGWDAKDRNESELIQVIVKQILSKLSPSKCMNKDLVGIESRLEKLMMLIGEGSNDTRVIGIWGTGGIGKTTIARVVYESICDEFEGSSFLANVRETSNKHGIVSLQKQLLSQILKGVDFNIYNEFDGSSMIKDRLQCKKVLIVLDDAHYELELDKLVQHDWVRLGSRIIITTRDQKLLKIHGVDKIYNVKGLNDADSVRLFSLRAFNSYQPFKDYEELSMQVVKYASGIPLALKVMGSSLFGGSVDQWEDYIKRLHKIDDKKILNILQISFDGLKESEKEIFLDLALFFKGCDRDYVIKVLDDFDPKIGIDKLVDKSLITISNANRIEMHDLLQVMAQRIAKNDSNQSGKRIWEKEDACYQLKNDMGREKIEGIMIEGDLNTLVSAKVFSKMINLRVLIIKNSQLVGDLKNLPEKLRLLEWHGCLLNSLPLSLQRDKIVDLLIYSGLIKQPPRRILPLMLTELCFVDCPYLKEVPDLTWPENLDGLLLENCPSLRRIRSPHLILKKLSRLSVIDCANLTTLPRKISMVSLKECSIDGCPKLAKFPDITGEMEHLCRLSITGTAIRDLPSSIELLTELKVLNLWKNRNLVTLPDSINGLKYLWHLNLSGCSSLKSLPTTINDLEDLWYLNLSSCFKHMKNRRTLSFRGSKGQPSDSSFFRQLLPSCDLREEAIPDDFFSSFVSLRFLVLCGNDIVSLLKSINCLQKLESLFLKECKRLRSVPELPSSTRLVNVDDCASLETLSDAFKANTSFDLHISCKKCWKLYSGDSGSGSLMFAMLKDFLKGPITRRKFSMVGNGSEIPEWVRYQSVGSKIRMERHRDLYDNKLVGFAEWSVYADGYRPGPRLKLLYLPREPWAKQFSYAPMGDVGAEVKKCGVHPIYEKDLQDLNPIMNQSSSCTCSQDFIG